MKEVKFEATKEENQLVKWVVARARSAKLIQRSEVLDLAMDLEAVHSNGCPLDFQKLVDAGDFGVNLGCDCFKVGRKMAEFIRSHS